MTVMISSENWIGWIARWRVAVSIACLGVVTSLATAQQDEAARHEFPWRQIGGRSGTQHHPLYNPLRERPSEDARDDTPEVLLWRLSELHSTLQYEKALELARRLVEVAPDQPSSHYNYACVLARLRYIDAALNELDAAIDHGWRNAEHTRLDLDLGPLHAHPRFERLLQRMRDLRAGERISPAPIRSGSWQEIAADLDEHVPEILRRYQLPGVSIAVIRDDEVWERAYGVADRALKTPMASEARFAVEPPLHLLVLVASLQQEQEGRLRVAEFIQYSQAGRDRSTTHAAARSRSGELAYLISGPSRSVWAAEDQTQAAPLANRRTFDLLLTAVEITSEQPFARYCQERILEPAGAESTVLKPHGDFAGTAVGHNVFGTPLAAPPEDAHVMLTTAADLARIVKSLEAGRAERRTQPLTSRMRRSSAGVGDLGLDVGFREGPHGLRLHMDGHGYGQGCLVTWYPGLRVGVVVLFNGQVGAEAARRIGHMAIGGD